MAESVSVVLSGDTDRPIYVLGQPMTIERAELLRKALSWAIYQARTDALYRRKKWGGKRSRKMP